MMDYILHFISGIPISYIYLVLVFTIFMENITPFIPGDTFLVFSAYLAGRGVLQPLFMYILTVVSSLSGFFLVYWIGYHWGRDYFEKKNFSFFPIKRIKQTDFYFNKYGDRILLINRFMPGFRLMVAIIAGFTRTNFIKTFFYTIISILAWNGLIFQLVKLLGENWQDVKNFLSKYNLVVTVIILAVVLLFIVYHLCRKTVKLGETK